MVALPGDRAIAAYWDVDKANVTMIDSFGMATGKPYTLRTYSQVTGLIHYHPWVYIIEKDGFITKISEDLNSDTASVVREKSDGYIHPGDVIQEDVILLINRREGTVFTYNMKTKKEEIKITGLNDPVHVFRCDMDGQPVYVVTKGGGGCHIKIYNSDWNLMREFGRRGRGDGELWYPECTVILPNGDLLVADTGNNRISQFKQDVVFVKHLITGLDEPTWMSFRDSMLWVVDRGKAACYQISDKVTGKESSCLSYLCKC